MISAIPTQYNGVSFRSRLEARWAMFFDLVSLSWEYEPEAFNDGKGTLYLPDFWLPEPELFVEIKPTVDCLSDAREKLMTACSARSSCGFVFAGSPLCMNGRFVGLSDTESGGGTYFGDDIAGLAASSRNSMPLFLVDVPNGERILKCDWQRCECVCQGNYKFMWEEWGVDVAAKRATMHRFHN